MYKVGLALPLGLLLPKTTRVISAVVPHSSKPSFAPQQFSRSSSSNNGGSSSLSTVTSSHPTPQPASSPPTAAKPSSSHKVISNPRPFSTTSKPNGPSVHAMASTDKDEITSYLKQTHDRVFEHNRAWAAAQRERDPDFFLKLAAGQKPEYLWIGCSDSRIPAEQITGLEPGEAFIHRNIANLVCSIDLNVMSVIDYAVQHLAVKHIVVCGHYGCGGVKAAMTPRDMGILNPWLRNIRDVYRLHEGELDAIADEQARYDRLVELNVMEQCRNVIKTAAVQQCYAKGRFPIVHGWVFGFKDGILKDLKVDHEEMLRKVQKIYNLTEGC